MKQAFRLLVGSLLVAVAVTAVEASEKDSYPKDKIVIVVPYSAGNGLDLLGREFAEVLRQQLNVPVIVENRDGAAGLIGTQYAARAKADGYTLLFTANPPFLTSPFSLEKAPYNPVASFTPIARVASSPLVLVVSSKLPIRNVAQLRDYVRRNPQSGSYASAGLGSPGQIYGELLNQALDLHMQDVRYKATGQGLVDVLAGNVLVSLVSVAAASQHIKSGALTALAMGSKQRMPEFKDVPTLGEALGRKNFEASVWYGFLVPTGVPEARITMLNREITKAAESKQIQAFLRRQYMVQDVFDAAHFSKSLQQELIVSKQLVEDAKLRAK